MIDRDREYQNAKDWVDAALRKALAEHHKTGDPIIHIPEDKDIDGVIVKGVGEKRFRDPPIILFAHIRLDHGAQARGMIEYIARFLA